MSLNQQYYSQQSYTCFRLYRNQDWKSVTTVCGWLWTVEKVCQIANVAMWTVNVRLI